MIWVNHNSTLLLGIGILTGVAFFLLRDGIKTRDLLQLAVLAVAFVALWFWIRPRQTDQEQIKQLQSRIGAGVPVLLEIQSPH